MNNLNILKVLEEKFDVPQHELLEFIKSSPRKYKVYQIPKRTSGTRTIAQPTAELKKYQRYLVSIFTPILPVHKNAFAYIQGKSIKDNALIHSNNSYFLKMDFSNFFNSLTPHIFWNFFEETNIKLRLQKDKEQKEEFFASPIEKAIAYLQNLDKKQLVQQGDVKEYYSEMTDITRTYIEESVHIPAMESTSSELIESLKKAIKDKKMFVNREDLEKFSRVLENSDLVKFAKSQPMLFEIETDKKIIDKFLLIIDKALPRTEDQAAILFAEEVRKKEMQKQKFKRLVMSIGISMFLLVASVVIFAYTVGFDFIKDKYIGHSTKELLEKEWITSEYGEPAIIISSPKVLKRTIDEKIQNNLPENVKSTSRFMYGSITDDFSIVLITTAYKDTTKIDLDLALEADLKELENFDAKNIIVKTGEFENVKGLSGKKAYGTFTAFDPDSEEDIKMQYDIMVLSQPGGAQEFFFMYREEDEHAKQIIEKIQNSIELRKAKK